MILLGLLILFLIGAVYLGGMMVQKAHVATRRAYFHQTPEAVWAAILKPDWRSDAREFEDLGGAPRRWRETNPRGSVVEYEELEAVPMRRFVSRIASEGLPYGGQWTYELEPDSGGTWLRVTENGEIYNPPFRLIAKLFFDMHSTIERYLRDLGQKFGETPKLES
jgi:hypothetical protein